MHGYREDYSFVSNVFRIDTAHDSSDNNRVFFFNEIFDNIF